MEHVVHRVVEVKRASNVVADELEALVADQVVDVLAAAGDQVVDADHAVALGQQPLAQVRAEEAGAAGHHRGGHAGLPSACGRPIETYWKPALASFAGS